MTSLNTLNCIFMLRSMIELFYLIWIFTRFLHKTNSNQLSNIDTDQIELTQLINNEKQIRLRCDAKSRNARDSLILLSCPLSRTGVCRQNCINPCLVNETSSVCSDAVTLAIPKCIYRSMANDHIQIEYVIHLDAINEKGQWWCIFRGKRSNFVELDSYYHFQQKTTIRSQYNQTNNLKTINRYDTIVDITTEIDISSNLIQLIIGLVGISIAFNIFFFARCFAVRNYLKNLHIGHSRNYCLDQLLCIDQPRKLSLNTTRINHIQHINSLETPKIVKKSSTTLEQTITTTTMLNEQQWCESINIIYKSPIQQQQQQQQSTYYSKYPTLHNSIGNHNGSSMEFIYDEVHNSVYTTLNNQSSDYEKNKEMMFQKRVNNTIRTVYDAGDWLVDRSGQIYVPYAQITPKPQRILLNNFEYSTLRKNDVIKNPSLLNTIAETCKQKNVNYFGQEIVTDNQQQQQQQQEQQQQQQQLQQQYLPSPLVQTEIINSVNNNTIPDNSITISDSMSLPLTNQQLLLKNIPVEVNELDNVIEENANLSNFIHSIDKFTNQSIKQNDLNTKKTFNYHLISTNKLNIDQNSDQSIINKNDLITSKVPIKFLSRKNPTHLKQHHHHHHHQQHQIHLSNNNDNHNQLKVDNDVLPEAYKIANLEDWSMIDHD
ncbi:hypothetical protein KSF78_0004286 [Schistosoma japonicum]|nr:hypothetical protein KSF78_0004286 [Schistosoma japonicum]